MTTSGQGLANVLLDVALVVLALGLARGLARNGFRPRVRPAALALWLVVAVPSLLQLAIPGLLDALRRDPGLVERGQLWRVLTSAIVQDGGVAGTVSNLVLLAVVAVIAEAIWGGLRMWLVVGVAQLVFGLWTSLVFPSRGAGNSAFTLALAASLAGLALTMAGPRSALRLAVAGGVVVVGVALVALLDAHGVAVLAGVAVGAGIGAVSPPPQSVLRESKGSRSGA